MSGNHCATKTPPRPVTGTLYDTPYADNVDTTNCMPITTVGQVLTYGGAAGWVMFVPEEDGFGSPYATFEYTVTVADLTSANVTRE